MSTRISLEEARKRLGEGVIIDLEPAGAVAVKVAAGKEGDLWVFDPEGEGRIGRGDRRFHEARLVHHPGGWNICAIVEEPGVAPPAEGPRIVGHVIVEVSPRGFVHVREANGLNGKVWELKPSSLSKGDLDESGRQPDAIYEANPQRISGSIAVYLQQVDFPDTEGMTPSAFVAASTDGRSITAIAKLGLL